MQVVAGCVWVPKERIWALEVFIVGEGIHFIVDDSVRLMGAHRALCARCAKNRLFSTTGTDPTVLNSAPYTPY